MRTDTGTCRCCGGVTDCDPQCNGYDPVPDGPRKPFLKDGALYFSDNGRIICSKCAGMSARFSGRDISGQKIARVKAADLAEWQRSMGEPMACEAGCTTLPAVVRS